MYQDIGLVAHRVVVRKRYASNTLNDAVESFSMPTINSDTPQNAFLIACRPVCGGIWQP